jgi:hypothetical protein
LLEDPELRLATLPDEVIEGRPVVGVEVTGPGRTTASLYFDRATRLLVLVGGTTCISDGITLPFEFRLSDYRMVQGVQFAMRRVAVCGHAFYETRVKELQLLKAIEPEKFAKP